MQSWDVIRWMVWQKNTECHTMALERETKEIFELCLFGFDKRDFNFGFLRFFVLFRFTRIAQNTQRTKEKDFRNVHLKKEEQVESVFIIRSAFICRFHVAFVMSRFAVIFMMCENVFLCLPQKSKSGWNQFDYSINDSNSAETYWWPLPCR